MVATFPIDCQYINNLGKKSRNSSASLLPIIKIRITKLAFFPIPHLPSLLHLQMLGHTESP